MNKKNNFWGLGLFLIILPVLLGMLNVVEIHKFKKIISIYSIFGFIPVIIIFLLLNYFFNNKNKYLILVIGLLLGVSWFLYLLFLLLTGEFV